MTERGGRAQAPGLEIMVHKREKRAVLLLCALLAAFFLLQLTRINQAPWENYDSWRQTDTYTIAQNYVRYDMNPLHPQFNYDGPGENYVQLELQVMPYLSALVFKLTGSQPFWVPRLISLLFFMGSASFTFGIGRQMLKNDWAALCGAAVYLALPISVLYARAIMPEAAALLFYTGAIYYFMRWYEKGGMGHLAVSALLTALAIMEKTPVIFVGILFVALFFQKERLRSFRHPGFYTFGALSLGLPLAYYWYASRVATFTFVNNIAEKHIFTDMFRAVFTPQAREFFKREMPLFFGWAVLIAAAVGVVVCILRRNRPLLLWTGSMLLETVTIVAVIRFGYYMVFLAPLAAVLCAALCDLLRQRTRLLGAVAACLLFACTAVHTAWRAWPLATVNEAVTRQAQVIEAHTQPGDVIAVAAQDPVLLGACGRMGYRANLRYYDYIPTEPRQELAYFRQQGVRYFVAPGGAVPGEEGDAYLALLEQGYEAVYRGPECLIFDLEASK